MSQLFWSHNNPVDRILLFSILQIKTLTLRDSGLSTGHSPDKWYSQDFNPDCLIPKGFPSHCYVEESLWSWVSDISQSLPVTLYTKIESHGPDHFSTLQIQEAPAWFSQLRLIFPFSDLLISCCAVWLGVYFVLSCFLCIHILSQPKDWKHDLGSPEKNLRQWQSQGKKLTNKSFHSTAVSIHRRRALIYTFNSFCDLGHVTCLSFNFSFFISKAEVGLEKIL